RAAALEGKRRLRSCATRAGRIRQAAARQQSHDRALQKAGTAPMKVLQEVRILESQDETKVGDRVLVENFKAGENVDVSGVSKGKGFQGGVKRWHYAGGDSTHGSMFHRAPGGIGGSSFPSRVWPNQHFPGHMGHE